MDKLGSIVVIAGRNGAGKSRLLRKIAQIKQQPAQELLQLKSLQRMRDSRSKLGSPNSAHVLARLAELEQKKLEYDRVTFSGSGGLTFIPFVPNRLELADPNTMAKGAILTAAKGTASPGVTNLPGGTLALIQLSQDRAREASHQDRIISTSEAERAIQEYDRLKSLVRQFLNTEITRSVNGEAQLFGLPLGKAALSDGQKVLLQLCIAIYSQANSLNNLIILMDEPENHLHPGALLDLINSIQSHLGDGQLWIATHSIPLLAEVPPSSIWWMEGNSISKAGSNPCKVLDGLLGNDMRRARLAEFLDLPFAMASNRFAAECLMSPDVVGFRESDPQSRQIGSIISQLSTTSESLRILDFGAGKGRLIAELAEALPLDKRDQIDYIAYDTSKNCHEECASAISKLYSNIEHRLFHDASELRARYDAQSFDVVVMCNVLHEVPPTAWGDLFGESGKITQLLKATGYLLIVEVQQLPYGELAHQNGFCVLDSAQLKKLFVITENDLNGFVITSERNGWLKAHLVSKSLVARYTPSSRRSAIEDLCSTARDRIKELRAKPNSYLDGRLHGFWVQQFANAELALREI